MDRLESGICVSVLKLQKPLIVFSVYGIAKDSDINAIKENILHLAKEMTKDPSPTVRISVGPAREITLENITMENLLSDS